MMRVANTASLIFVGLFLCAPLVSAQQGGSGGNTPPPPAGESSSQTAPVSPYDQALQPQTPPQDERGPINGVEQPRLGGLSLGKSLLIPSLSFQETFDTNSQNAGTAATRVRESITTISGGLNLQWMGKNSALKLGYVGSGFLYDTTSQSHQFLQGLNVSESFTLRRWTVLIGDNFSYIPQSLYGLGGYGFDSGSQVTPPGGNFGAGTGGTSFNPYFLPGQSIQGNARRISNSTLGQVSYLMGPRSSLNLSTSFSVVHFLDPGFINSRSAILNAGYDFKMNARNSVGFSYGASLFRYAGSGNGFTTHTVYFNYSRRITGRLIAVVGAGPAIFTSTGLAVPPATPAGTQVSWSVNSSLSYLTPRGSIEASYSRHTSEGSGLLLGAQSNDVELAFNRQLNRIWSGSITGGYNRNDSLNQTLEATSSALRFSGWRAGLTLARPIGRYLRMQLRYEAGRQTSNATGCTTAVLCGSVSLRQTIGVAISWTYRPIALE
jgi:hypothetical protein